MQIWISEHDYDINMVEKIGMEKSIRRRFGYGPTIRRQRIIIIKHGKQYFNSIFVCFIPKFDQSFTQKKNRMCRKDAR
jgi:hypothetical protein